MCLTWSQTLKTGFLVTRLKYNCPRKGMQEKKSIMVVWCELKILSPGINASYHKASLIMPKSFRYIHVELNGNIVSVMEWLHPGVAHPVNYVHVLH